MANGILTKSVKGSSGYVVLRFVSSGGLRLNANSSFSGANAVGEVVQSMNIVGIFYSCGNNVVWTVKRGGNTVLQLSGADSANFQEGILPDTLGGEPQANVTVTKVGAGHSVLLLKLHKRSAVTGGASY